MSMFGNNGYNGGNGGENGYQSNSFVRHLREFVGETVTIFTTSGGASGCGFTGCILSVNSCFVRLVTDLGVAPSNPLDENICDEFEGCGGGGRGDVGGINLNRGNGRGHGHDNGRRTVGSVCDIPIDRIAAFCHNAI